MLALAANFLGIYMVHCFHIIVPFVGHLFVDFGKDSVRELAFELKKIRGRLMKGNRRTHDPGIACILPLQL